MSVADSNRHRKLDWTDAARFAGLVTTVYRLTDAPDPKPGGPRKANVEGNVDSDRISGRSGRLPVIWLAEGDWESLDDVPHSVFEQAKALIRRTSHVLFMDSTIARSGSPIRVSDLAPPLPDHQMTEVDDLARLGFGDFDATEVVVIDATTSGPDDAG